MFSKQPWMYDSTKPSFYPYLINHSMRLNGTNAYLSKTNFGSSDNTSKRTFSTWIKYCNDVTAASYTHIVGAGASNIDGFGFNQSETLQFLRLGVSTHNGTANIRDVSGWYHFMFTWDHTAGNWYIYINGQQDATGSTSGALTKMGQSGQTNTIGKRSNQATYIHGYLADTVFLDGVIKPVSDFGETKESIWIPKDVSDTLSLSDFGTNGYYLNYADSSDLGKDVSGKGNHWTSNNLAAEDQVPDSPTNNFATMNAVDDSSMNYSEGNLRPTPASDYKATRGTIGIPTSGKWYFEARVITGGGGNIQDQMIGVATSSNVLEGTSPYPQAFTFGVGYVGSGQINRAGSANQTSLTALSAGTIVGVAVNVDDNEVQFYLNGSAVGTAKQLVSTSEPNFPMFVGATNRSSQFNFGQDSTFAGAISAGGNADANGTGDFAYAPPSDHLALCTFNLSDPTIDPNGSTPENPTDHFNTLLYTGDGATSRSITGVGFGPDFVWIKCRSHTEDHALSDVVRGADRKLETNNTTVEETSTSSPTAVLSAFGSDGFTGPASSPGNLNVNSRTYVAWNWKAGGSAVANNDGTIQSSISANTKAGFSIVGYTGNGVGAATVGHGLTKTPELVISKNRDADQAPNYWHVNHVDLTAADYNIFLNLTSAQSDVNTNYAEGGIGLGDADVINFINGTGGANSVANANKNGSNYITYCFHSVDGFSSVGSYLSNNSADGPFSYTGFRPAFLLLKRAQASANWLIFDDKRDTYNQMRYPLFPSANNGTYTSNLLHVDFLSNGFKIRNGTYGETNAPANQKYIYIAFAKQPLKYANAR